MFLSNLKDIQFTTNRISSIFLIIINMPNFIFWLLSFDFSINYIVVTFQN